MLVAIITEFVFFSREVMPGDTGDDYVSDVLQEVSLHAPGHTDIDLKNDSDGGISEMNGFKGESELDLRHMTDLALSDPDLATSSSGVGSLSGGSLSSRPGSSSGGMTPDLPLPNAENYTTETGK